MADRGGRGRGRGGTSRDGSGGSGRGGIGGHGRGRGRGRGGSTVPSRGTVRGRGRGRGGVRVSPGFMQALTPAEAVPPSIFVEEDVSLPAVEPHPGESANKRSGDTAGDSKQQSVDGGGFVLDALTDAVELYTSGRFHLVNCATSQAKRNNKKKKKPCVCAKQFERCVLAAAQAVTTHSGVGGAASGGTVQIEAKSIQQLQAKQHKQVQMLRGMVAQVERVEKQVKQLPNHKSDQHTKQPHKAGGAEH